MTVARAGHRPRRPPPRSRRGNRTNASARRGCTGENPYRTSGWRWKNSPPSDENRVHVRPDRSRAVRRRGSCRNRRARGASGRHASRKPPFAVIGYRLIPAVSLVCGGWNSSSSDWRSLARINSANYEIPFRRGTNVRTFLFPSSGDWNAGLAALTDFSQVLISCRFCYVSEKRTSFLLRDFSKAI